VRGAWNERPALTNPLVSGLVPRVGVDLNAEAEGRTHQADAGPWQPASRSEAGAGGEDRTLTALAGLGILSRDPGPASLAFSRFPNEFAWSGVTERP